MVEPKRIPIIVTIRYSLLQNNYQKNYNKMGKLSPEDYRRQLFGDERLKTHLHLFGKLTLPSLQAAAAAATGVALGVFVLTSTELPPQHRAALDALVAGYDFATVIAVRPDVVPPHRECVLRFLRDTGMDRTAYAHARLDDDDAISIDFLDRLGAYIRPELSGFVVSLCSGFLATVDSSLRISGLYEYYYPKIAIGLAAVGHFDRLDHSRPKDVLNIYEMGNHAKLDRRVPVIIDAKRPAFVRTIHAEQDSTSEGLIRLPEPASPEILASQFSLEQVALPSLEQSIGNRRAMHERMAAAAKTRPRASA